ncbi:MAG: hypothetical protein JJD97_09845, partial [Gemmatimonadaceae bacterium]|nr:hypothetical protein [Gemmatimonadaceae bacterium]
MHRQLLVSLAALIASSAPALRAQAMPGVEMPDASAAMSGEMMPMAH